MLAVDSFHVDCALTLKRIYVFFALEVGDRCVHILGTTSLWVPASLRTPVDLPVRHRLRPGMIHRWR
jgi:hypothetical protein